jgi:hypothetical protein
MLWVGDEKKRDTVKPSSFVSQEVAEELLASRT